VRFSLREDQYVVAFWILTPSSLEEFSDVSEERTNYCPVCTAFGIQLFAFPSVLNSAETISVALETICAGYQKVMTAR
jgi:hypothetical protein